MTNLNAAGVEYELTAVANDWNGYGVLTPEAIARIEALRASAVGQRSDPSRELVAGQILRLLRRADAALYHAANAFKLIDEVKSLPASAKHKIPADQFSPELSLQHHDPRLGYELSSSILHCAATLDTLSVDLEQTISNFKLKRTGKHKPQVQFSNVLLGLDYAAVSDHRAVAIAILIRSQDAPFSDVLLRMGRKTLRNHLAHQSDLNDLLDANFMVHWIAHDKVLRIDQQVYGLPISKTLRDLIWSLMYLVTAVGEELASKTETGTYAAYAIPATLVTRSIFEPQWLNPLLSLNDFLSNAADAITVSVVVADENNISIQQKMVDRRILDHAVI